MLITSRIKWPKLILHVVFLVIVLVNFSWNEWLIGWDALNPELSLSLNIKRGLFSAWQEKGLGFVGGHGYATLLPYSLIAGLLKLVIKVNLVRPVFTLLCFYIGGIGMFHLSRLVLGQIAKKKQKKLGKVVDWIALGVSLAYWFNLATIQMFYLPLDAFVIQFASLPWLFFTLILWLGKREGKWLKWFGLVILMSSMQGFIPQLFLVYFVSLVVFLVIYANQKRFSKIVLKKAGVVIGLTLLINAYWLLIVGYYSISGEKTELSYNKLITTDDFASKSYKYGDLKDVTLLRSFFWESQQLDEPVLKPWIDHQNKLGVTEIGYVVFGLVGLGIVFSLFWFNNVLAKGFVGAWLVFFNGMAVGVWPFSFINKVFNQIWPIYGQLFRITFTKFSLGLGFMNSLLLGVGVFGIVSFFAEYKKLKRMIWLMILFLIGGMIWYGLPIFKGNLFYRTLTVELPSAYQELIGYFNDKNIGRVVDLPQGCSEGWYSYSWGYFGSGFYQYGIEQPILARTFDVWSNENENYYWEMKQVLERRDYKAIDSILEKYDVNWILFDPDLYHCRTKNFRNNDELVKYFEESSNYILEKKFFGDGVESIRLFKFNSDNQLNKFVKIEDGLVIVGPEYGWNDEDVAYKKYGDYLVSENPDVFYPFRSLFTGRRQEELEFEVEEKDNQITFKASLPESLEGYSLVLPELEGIEEKQVVNQPKVRIVEGELWVEISNDGGIFSFDSNETGEILNAETKSCNPFNTGQFEKQGKWAKSGETTWFRSVGSSNCVSINLPNLSQNLGYLVQVDSRYIEGKSLLFYVINQMSQSRVIETELPKDEGSWSYVVPPMEEYGLGYSINFDNISIGRQETINELKGVKVYPIPYRLLKQIKLVKDEMEVGVDSRFGTWNIEVKHPNPSYYEVSLDGEGKGTLVLSQSFDKGWVGYKDRLFGERLDKHVLVNNWSNGWEIAGDEQRIILWFWPQALEYLGFGGLIIAIGIVLRTKDRQRRLS